jgi:hypothetical protein
VIPFAVQTAISVSVGSPQYWKACCIGNRPEFPRPIRLNLLSFSKRKVLDSRFRGKKGMRSRPSAHYREFCRKTDPAIGSLAILPGLPLTTANFAGKQLKEACADSGKIRSGSLLDGLSLPFN